MANMLLGDLNPLDRAHLVGLTMQPGWKILLQMFEQQCQLATTKVIQLNPEDTGYAQKLANVQINARATNDFCSSILKSIQAHCEALGQERETEKLDTEDAKKVLQTFRNTVVQQ